MRIEGSNLVAANFNFQISSWASLSLRIVRAEEKESQNLFTKIRAAARENPLIMQSSSSSQRKKKKREKEEGNRWRHHLKHQSYVCMAPSNNIVNINIAVELNWKIQTLDQQFSTTVPEHTSVPRVASKCAARL